MHTNSQLGHFAEAKNLYLSEIERHIQQSPSDHTNRATFFYTERFWGLKLQVFNVTDICQNKYSGIKFKASGMWCCILGKYFQKFQRLIVPSSPASVSPRRQSVQLFQQQYLLAGTALHPRWHKSSATLQSEVGISHSGTSYPQLEINMVMIRKYIIQIWYYQKVNEPRIQNTEFLFTKLYMQRQILGYEK